MKTIKFTGIVLAALLLSARLMAQDSKEQLVIPLSDPGKPFKLEVGLISGSIKITGYDGKDVVIDAQAEVNKRDDRERTSNGMKRLSPAGGLDVSAREKNNVVTVSSGVPMRKVMLSIKVPAGASHIKLETINDGTISASDVSSDFEVTNINGAIKLNNVSGSVVANTINGSVVVVFKSIDAKAAMAFTTLNGNVDVTFPTSLKANFKLKTDHGDVFSDFDVVTDKTEPKANKTAKDGMYRITIEDWIYGKVNGGGPEMLMKNMNGNIYIRKAK